MRKILLLTMVLSMFSCENYVDVNDEQRNNPDASLLTPTNMLAGAINNYVNYQVVSLNSFGNEMAYVWAINSGFTSTASYFTYNFTSNDYAGLFSNAYYYADNFQDIIDKASVKPEYSYHYGVAKVFKVMAMDYVVSLYGDAPYSQAFKSDISRPSYDDDATIIPKLLLELDQARNYLENPNSNVVDLGSEDIVFHGDVDKWIKLVNTIELRILMRLSNTTNSSLITLRNQRFANLDNNFVDEDVTSNPGYNVSTLGQRNPIFRTWGLNEALNAWTSSNRANACGEFIGKLITGQQVTTNLNSTGVVDPRRTRMFATVTGQPTTTFTKQGVFPVSEVSRMSSFIHGRTGSSAAAADNAASSRDAYLMLAAESYFLQAEAVQRGYMTGNAQTLFNMGITASFAFYSDYSFTDVAGAALNPSTYISAIDSKPGLGWTASSNKVNAIITQKYLALAQWSGVELYIDHMRTGFPELPLPVGVTQTSRPKRLIYPTSEYSSNGQNVPSVTLPELFTVNSKTPVYLQ